VLNPKKEWITRQDERLRIVSDELWGRVKARQTAQTHRIGERIRQGMSRGAAIRTGTGGKFLLSGLLRCGHCGSAYVIAGVDRYACSGHTNGGDALCENNAMLRRQLAEAEVLAGIKRELRSPEVINELVRRVRAALRARKPKAPDHAGRIKHLRVKIDNLADAIASGALRSSPTIAAKLAAAEGELERLTAAQAESVRAVDVTPLLADLPARAVRAIEQLEATLSNGDIPKAREEIRKHVGTVTIEADAREIRIYSEQNVSAVLLRIAGAAHTSIDGSGGSIRHLLARLPRHHVHRKDPLAAALAAWRSK
jgi:hypothetical protein